MPAYENVYMVTMITDARDSDTARYIQESELDQFAFDYEFISGDSA